MFWLTISFFNPLQLIFFLNNDLNLRLRLLIKYDYLIVFDFDYTSLPSTFEVDVLTKQNRHKNNYSRNLIFIKLLNMMRNNRLVNMWVEWKMASTSWFISHHSILVGKINYTLLNYSSYSKSTVSLP